MALPGDHEVLIEADCTTSSRSSSLKGASSFWRRDGDQKYGGYLELGATWLLLTSAGSWRCWSPGLPTQLVKWTPVYSLQLKGLLCPFSGGDSTGRQLGLSAHCLASSLRVLPSPLNPWGLSLGDSALGSGFLGAFLRLHLWKAQPEPRWVTQFAYNPGHGPGS